MLDYRLINQLDSDCTGAHLVTWPGSTLLAQAPLNAVPLLAEMVEQAARGEVADTRFGCSPFARITLIPPPLWRDTLNDGLAEALRPLCKKPVSETLILDASLEESSGALTKALRELFNLDWQLDDLGLHQVKAARPRLRQLALYALPEQRSALDTLAHRQRATAHGMLAARRSSVPRSTWWKKPGVCARISARCAAKFWMKKRSSNKGSACCMRWVKALNARRACWRFIMMASARARFAATSVKASPLIPADCGSRKAPGCTP